MRHCEHCRVDIKGIGIAAPFVTVPWIRKRSVTVPNPYPDIPLRFNKQYVMGLLTWLSLVLIVAYFFVELLLGDKLEGAPSPVVRRDEHVAGGADPHPETAQHREGDRLFDRLRLLPLHLLGLCDRLGGVVDDLRGADRLQLCASGAVHRRACGEAQRRRLCPVFVGSRLDRTFPRFIPAP